jgi:release factor glutamine methyltransferase
MSEAPSPAASHTLGSALTWGRTRLGNEARDADYLLAAAMGCSLAHLRAYAEAACAPAPWQRYRSWVDRRALGEPLAYLLGTREFWSQPLAVGPGVLIPRPDSELLVEAALQRVSIGQTGWVADVGCGSANLSIALASERPRLRLLAIERSDAALPWARRNIDARAADRCVLLQADLLSALRAQSLLAVIANLPYIDPADPDIDPATAAYEPAAALYADDAGLALIAALIMQAKRALQPGGWLLLEHGWRQGEAVLGLLRQAGYTASETLSDLAGRPRVSLGQLG